MTDHPTFLDTTLVPELSKLFYSPDFSDLVIGVNIFIVSSFVLIDNQSDLKSMGKVLLNEVGDIL